MLLVYFSDEARLHLSNCSKNPYNFHKKPFQYHKIKKLVYYIEEKNPWPIILHGYNSYGWMLTGHNLSSYRIKMWWTRVLVRPRLGKNADNTRVLWAPCDCNHSWSLDLSPPYFYILDYIIKNISKKHSMNLDKTMTL